MKFLSVKCFYSRGKKFPQVPTEDETYKKINTN